jgi:hypothetical protein
MKSPKCTDRGGEVLNRLQMTRRGPPSSVALHLIEAGRRLVRACFRASRYRFTTWLLMSLVMRVWLVGATFAAPPGLWRSPRPWTGDATSTSPTDTALVRTLQSRACALNRIG